MRAVVHDSYGGPEVLRLVEVPRPEPRADELLVRIHATTVNRSDCGIRSGRPFFVRGVSGVVRPRWSILGTEYAGEVRAVGSAVTAFEVGDAVFGVHAWRFGTHADYVCVAQDGPVARKPERMSFDQAAAVCDGVILALTCLRRGDVGPGRRILVYGASGSIGTAAVQLGRHLGAHVTAVCSTPNLELVRSLGAHLVVDYTREDFAARGETYDVIFDAVGKSTFGRCKDSLVPGGIFIATDLGPHGQNPLLALTTRLGSRRVAFPLPRYTQRDVLLLKGLIDAGDYRAVIDRTYPLEEVVEATRYVETEQKTGNVVLTVVAGSDREPSSDS